MSTRVSPGQRKVIMALVFITGSADGLGQLAARRLLDLGHEVVLHARSAERAREAMAAVPGAREALVGDLSSIAETRKLAEEANAAGPFDAIIHNAGVGYRERRVDTIDGLEHLFAINVLAAYTLTALISPPRRLIDLGSGMHRGGDLRLDDFQWRHRRWNGAQAYSNSKLFDVVLAFAVARRFPAVLSNAVEPGWVATKMGGAGAPDDLKQGAETQVWLAVSDDPRATVSGRYFYHRQLREAHDAASDVDFQEALIPRPASDLPALRSAGGTPARARPPEAGSLATRRRARWPTVDSSRPKTKGRPRREVRSGSCFLRAVASPPSGPHYRSRAGFGVCFAGAAGSSLVSPTSSIATAWSVRSTRGLRLQTLRRLERHQPTSSLHRAGPHAQEGETRG